MPRDRSDFTPWVGVVNQGPVVSNTKMRLYRWCLCFGEFVLNWEDLTAADVAATA